MDGTTAKKNHYENGINSSHKTKKKEQKSLKYWVSLKCICKSLCVCACVIKLQL